MSHTVIENNEEEGVYLSDILLDSKLVTQVKNHGNLDLVKTEGTTHTGLNALLKSVARKNILYFGIMEGEQAVRIEQATQQFQAPVITVSQISKRLEKIPESERKKIGYVHINTIQIILRSTFNEGIKTPVTLTVEDNRINSQYKKLGEIQGDLGYTVVKFSVTLQYPIPLATKKINNCIGITCQFHNQTLMEKGDIPLVICYRVAYALSNSSLSIGYKHQDKIYTDELFSKTSTLIKENTLTRDFLRQSSHNLLPISKPGLLPSSSFRSIIPPITEKSLLEEVRKEDELSKMNSRIKELSELVTKVDRKI